MNLARLAHSRDDLLSWKQVGLTCLVVLASLFPGVDAWAGLQASQQPRFERIGQEQGLYKKTITCGLQDRYGFLWFGTEDGLLRYDGYTFKEFLNDPTNPNSLSSNLVYALEEDRKGNLWIGTVGGGLNRYEISTGKFIRYLHDDKDSNSLSHNGVVALKADSKGNLWIGTEGGGLNRLGPDQRTFSRYNHNPADPGSLAYDTIWQISED